MRFSAFIFVSALSVVCVCTTSADGAIRASKQKPSTKTVSKKAKKVVEARSSLPEGLNQRPAAGTPAKPCDTVSTPPCATQLFGILYVTPFEPTVIAKLTLREITNKYWFDGLGWETENGVVSVSPDRRSVIFTQVRPPLGDQYISVRRCNSNGCAPMLIYVEVDREGCTITDSFEKYGSSQYVQSSVIILVGTKGDDIICLDEGFADVVLGLGGNDIFVGSSPNPLLIVPGAGHNFVDSYGAVVATTNGQDETFLGTQMYRGPMPNWLSKSSADWEAQIEFVRKLDSGELLTEQKPTP